MLHWMASWVSFIKSVLSGSDFEVPQQAVLQSQQLPLKKNSCHLSCK